MYRNRTVLNKRSFIFTSIVSNTTISTRIVIHYDLRCTTLNGPQATSYDVTTSYGLTAHSCPLNTSAITHEHLTLGLITFLKIVIYIVVWPIVTRRQFLNLNNN